MAAALVVPMVWIGVYPAHFLRPMDRSVDALLQTMRQRGASIPVLGLEEFPLAEAPAEPSDEETGE